MEEEGREKKKERGGGGGEKVTVINEVKPLHLISCEVLKHCISLQWKNGLEE